MNQEPQILTGELVSRKRLKYPLKSWIPKGAKAQILVAHGFAEHIGSYEQVAAEVNRHGFSLHSFDLLGHGNAGGIRAHVFNLQEYIDQLEQVLKESPLLDKKLPIFLFGHSTGGLVSALYAMEYEDERVKGIVLSNPLMGFNPFQHKKLLWYFKYVHNSDPHQLWPKPTSDVELTRSRISLERLRRDPFRLRVITPRLYLQMHEWSDYLRAKAKEFQAPLLLLLSHKDLVVDSKKAKYFFDHCESTDKRLIYFAKAKHEIMQEPEMNRAVGNLIRWCSERI